MQVTILKKTRHENVALFMGACLTPPHLAVVTRLSLVAVCLTFCVSISHSMCLPFRVTMGVYELRQFVTTLCMLVCCSFIHGESLYRLIHEKEENFTAHSALMVAMETVRVGSLVECLNISFSEVCLPVYLSV